jgi:Rad3-related DNA helicase
MEFSLANQTVSLSVGEFAGFVLGPQDAGGGPQGLWRAQLGQHWHNELRKRTEQEFTVDGTLRPDVQFEIVIEGRLVHRGWTFTLAGRIDQIVGDTLREIKSVTRPLPAEEADLRADYPEYFRQLAAYAVLVRVSSLNSQLGTLNRAALRTELIFVEAGAGLTQTIALTPFDEALVHHQLDVLVEFLNQRLRATERRRSLQFQPAFTTLRPGQETIQADLASSLSPQASCLLFEAPTGYGKTGCVLEFALGQMRTGRFARLIWLTGKSTGQLQVVHTLQQMTGGTGPLDRFAATPADPTRPEAGFHPLAFWQVRNKAEHCVNHTFHCVRDNCDYLAGAAERWPGSGLAKFYLDDRQPRDLDTVRTAGRDARICPYEITRTALAFNDVWIGDFNYVFAPGNRGVFYDQPGFNPAETLLVIDEAHNLPSRVAGAYSHRAHERDTRLLLAELDHLQAPATLVHAIEEWIMLLASFKPADSLDPAQEAEVHDLVARIANLVATQPLDYSALGPQHAEALWQFAALGDFLNNTQLTKLLWVPREGELEFTCVDAAPAIGETLRQFGGAILMSATLQPYDNMAAACGLEGPACGSELARDSGAVASKLAPTSYITLQAPTPWRAGAYDVAVDLRVETTYKQRANHYGTTAATVETLHQAAYAQRAAHLPDDGQDKHRAGSSQQRRDAQLLTTPAVAVFFPSYAYAESVRHALEQNGSVLRVALQPKLPDLAAQTAWVKENLVLADALFLVLGSSFAEGIDLLGGRVSHAMVVGPALPEVNAVQKARLDALVAFGRDESFRRVYQIPGLQKVNQALGRLVRSPGQRAKVLLHCSRFAETSYASLLAMDYQLFSEVASEEDLQSWLALAHR